MTTLASEEASSQRRSKLSERPPASVDPDDLADIIAQVRLYHPEADFGLIREAYAFAGRMHEGQRRKSGDPYFVHPISVAGIIANLRLDTASICAALLHDVVEDTDVKIEEIGRRFGDEIAFLVDGVTKLGKVDFACKEDQQAESFRKMLVAMARDIRVLLVKLADRLDNMRTLEVMKPDAKERIAIETRDIYAPLAARLGIHWLKAELDDLSFRHLEPEHFAKLTHQMAAQAQTNERLIDEVTRCLNEMFGERNLPVEVSGRIKHISSVQSKMKRTGCDFEQVNDIVAFRVVTDNVEHCYATLGIIHSQWVPIPGRFKDYVALPKPNLYQSLHTTVLGPGRRRIEVQIRTRDMHRTAELGIAAHWQYKSRSGGIDKKDAARFAWLRQLMEFQQEISDPAEFLESVKVDLFADEVYVFTPKGDVKTLPRGGTPIDLAYSIHSEIGNHCSGAKVNDAIVPLRYKLRNGDVVEILTNTQQHPSKDWLDFVGTARARTRIRTYLRNAERTRSIQVGRDLLGRKMRQHGLSFQRFLKSTDVERIVREFRVQNLDELYLQVGHGRLAVNQLVEALTGGATTQKTEHLRTTMLERAVHKVTQRTEQDGLLIDGMDDVWVRFGKCCSPIAGDAVTGWITRGRGVTVHRRDCPRAMELDPERRVNVAWTKDSAVELPVSLRVVTDDRPGILATVSSILTQHHLNISEAICRSAEDHVAVNTFLFHVGSVSKLRDLIRKIAKVPGVSRVERI